MLEASCWHLLFSEVWGIDICSSCMSLISTSIANSLRLEKTKEDMPFEPSLFQLLLFKLLVFGNIVKCSCWNSKITGQCVHSKGLQDPCTSINPQAKNMIQRSFVKIFDSVVSFVLYTLPPFFLAVWVAEINKRAMGGNTPAWALWKSWRSGW